MFIITTKSIKRNKFDFANNCKKESNNYKTTFKTLFNQWNNHECKQEIKLKSIIEQDFLDSKAVTC